MANADYDLRFLQAGVNLLKDYLLSSDVYWPVGITAAPGQTPYPQLTLGALMLARLRLHALASTPEQRAELARLEEEMDTLRNRWRVAWGRKAQQEFRARLNLWRDFLEDYRENPEANQDRYAYEVGRRVMLYLLRQEADDIPEAELALLNGLDGLLRAVFVPGDFIWEPELAPSFPPDPHWYLYGNVKKS